MAKLRLDTRIFASLNTVKRRFQKTSTKSQKRVFVRQNRHARGI